MIDCLIPSPDDPLQLQFLETAQLPPDLRAFAIADAKQIIAGNEPWRANLLLSELLDLGAHEVVMRQAPMTGEAIGPMKREVLFESR